MKRKTKSTTSREEEEEEALPLRSFFQAVFYYGMAFVMGDEHMT